MKNNIKYNIPADGLAGLKENFKADAISGFLVFLNQQLRPIIPFYY